MLMLRYDMPLDAYAAKRYAMIIFAYARLTIAACCRYYADARYLRATLLTCATSRCAKAPLRC